jgi:hypothetical protein
LNEGKSDLAPANLQLEAFMSEFGDLIRASWHEAGHLVIALNHHLSFGDLKSQNGRPAIVNFDLNQDPEGVALFLVAGIAAEKIKFNIHDAVGASSDLSMLRAISSKWPIPSAELLLKQASSVLQENISALNRLQDEIQSALHDSAFDFSSEPLLIDRCSLQKIWERAVEK